MGLNFLQMLQETSLFLLVELCVINVETNEECFPPKKQFLGYFSHLEGKYEAEQHHHFLSKL